MARCRQLSLATLANIGIMSSTARSLCHRKAMLLTEHVGAHGDVGATRRRSERPQHSMAVFRPFGRGRGKDVREDSCAARGWLNFLICCRNLVKPAAAPMPCFRWANQKPTARGWLRGMASADVLTPEHAPPADAYRDAAYDLTKRREETGEKRCAEGGCRALSVGATFRRRR